MSGQLLSARCLASAAATILSLLATPLDAMSQTTLIAYYPFAGNALDISGNGHHGTVNGAQLTRDRFGVENNAYFFDGSSSITVPHSDEMSFGHDEPFSVCAWVKICGPQEDFAGIVVKGPTVTYRPGFQLVIRSLDRAATVVSIDADAWVGTTGRTRITDGLWHFIVLVVQPVEGWIRIYVDGREDGSVTSSRIQPDYQDQQRPLYIGRDRNAHVWLTGSVDDVAIFAGALSETSIAELYRENGWSGSSPVPGQRIEVSGCLGSTARLIASGEYREYSWSTGETSRSIRVSSPGRYTVLGTDKAGCPLVDTFDVSFVPGPTLAVSPPKSICLGDSVRLEAQASGGRPPYKFRWAPSDILSADTGAVVWARPAGNGAVEVIVTDSLGCEHRVAVNLTTRQDLPLGVDAELPFSFALRGERCDSIVVENRSQEEIIIDRAWLASNTHFGLPPAQLPITIPPRARRAVVVCAPPGPAGVWRDTLVVGGRGCSFRVPLAMSVFQEPILVDAECSTRIRFASDSSSAMLRAYGVRPNPTGDILTMELEVATNSNPPALDVRLVDARGIALVSGALDQRVREASEIASVWRVHVEFDVTAIPSGSYFLIVGVEGPAVTIPITIRR